MNKCCVLEYLYRDGGNWKTHGQLRLAGDPEGHVAEFRECLEWGDLFVAEQVGMPSLCPQHFVACGDGPSEMDHAYHEFADLRAATAADMANAFPARSLEDLLTRFQAASGRWDVTLSPNCWL